VVRKSCKKYPCHQLENMQCDFCYCPLYPCYDSRVGGKMIRNSEGKEEWDCSDCEIFHKKGNVSLIIEIMKNIKEREAKNAIQS
jgi:precorrin-3B C17-methyltransferase